MVASIDINLVATLVYWNIKLNAVSFVNFVMSVGLSVDYCVHIGHAYCRSEGVGDIRVKNAIRAMGGAVLKGGITTFVGVLILSFSSSEAFRIFFKMFFVTVIYGIYHALIVMPVILSLIGDYFVATAEKKTRKSRIFRINEKSKRLSLFS